MRRQQGIALVVVILSAMILLVALLAVTSTLAVSSRRTTTDQRVTLQAQYAAESGLSRARTKLNEAQGVLANLRVSANTNRRDILAHAQNFCGNGSVTMPRNPQRGDVLCEAAEVEAGDNGRFSLLTSFIPRSAYPEGVLSNGYTPDDYWRDIFSAGGKLVTTEVASDSASGAKTQYRSSFGLSPRTVRIMGVDDFRFEFDVSPVESVGEVSADNNVVATRTVRLEIPNTFEVTVNRPSFSEYALLINETRDRSGNPIFFGNGSQFNGRVHTNDTAFFLNTNGELPRFSGRFTSATQQRRFWGDIDESDDPEVFTDTPPSFGVDRVELPANSNNQIRASFGGDATDNSAVSERDLKREWNVSELNNGVYYSRGNGAEANTGNNLQGGLYVKGDVESLTFSTERGKQVIKITQEEVVGERYEWRWRWNPRRGRNEWQQVLVPVVAPKTTIFRQNGDDTWNVQEGDASPKQLGGDFNGMVYVDGDINNLGGDGTDRGDIAANSQLTLAATGDIVVSRSVTYTDDPREDKDALNVLGIYTNGGDVLLNGPSTRGPNIRPGDPQLPTEDIDLHATIMASAEDRGFGTFNLNANRGLVDGRQARINVLGGVIQNQSQGVSRGANGYRSSYTFDKRFDNGFAPPFFPTQTNWDGSADNFSRQQGLWEVKRR